MAEIQVEMWHNCYDDSWDGFIVPDAFAHPAKYARGLITRIFQYMLAEDMLAKGDVVVDPFGGIGTGGIIAASMGLQWIGCELEEKFAKLGRENFGLHLRTWGEFNDPIPILVNGDSRKLRENIRAQAGAVITSPPYANGLGKTSEYADDSKAVADAGRDIMRAKAGKAADARYSNSPNNLGNMPTGDVAAVVSSPPFLDARSDTTPSIKGQSIQGITAHDPEAWGGADAVISSPPYAESLKGDNSERETAEDTRAKRLTEGGSLGQSCRYSGYGGPGNLGNLTSGSVDSVVSSPPYEGCPVDGYGPNPGGGLAGIKSSGVSHEDWKTGERYGATTGQLGNSQGETFWSAARDIVVECHAILKHGGWSAWVVKDFIRNKQRVPFCDDWCKLLTACGFVVERRVRAMLVKHDSHPGLFGEEVVKTTKLASFFRRLYEKKYPENAIEWEEVVFARKRDAAIAVRRS